MMSIGTESARKCFAENIQYYADARVEPEKFNLYNGLWNLSGAISELESRVERLTRRIDELTQNNNLR